MAKGKVGESIDAILNDLAGGSAEDARPDEIAQPKKAVAKKAEPKGIPTPQPTDAALVPVTAIKTKPHETNTRRKVEVDDIVPSVAELGVVVPLDLYDNGDGSYTLVSGTRRLAAAKKVGLERVPAVMVNREVKNVELVAAVENLVRRDLEPLEEAEAYRVLIEGFKITQADLARLLSKSPAHVTHKLSLLKAPAKDRKKLAGGKVTEREVRRSAAKLAKPVSGKPGPKARIASTVSIPAEDLPDGVSLSIKEKFDVDYAEALGVPRQTATITMNVLLNPKAKGRGKVLPAPAKAIKSEIEKLIKILPTKRIDSAYKALRSI